MAYKLVCLGSTFTVGDTLDPSLAYPAVLQAAFAEKNIAVRVVNAAIRGETVQGAQERIPWLLQQRFDGMLLELGNLEQERGHAIDSTHQELIQLIATIREARPDADLFFLDLTGGTGSTPLPNLQSLAPDFPVDLRQISAAAQQRVADYLFTRLADQVVREPLSRQ